MEPRVYENDVAAAFQLGVLAAIQVSGQTLRGVLPEIETILQNVINRETTLQPELVITKDDHRSLRRFIERQYDNDRALLLIINSLIWNPSDEEVDEDPYDL